MYPKDYIVEDGHVYYRKKPLHKQPLFWTTLAGGLASLGMLFLSFFLFFVIGVQGLVTELDTTTDSSYYYDDESYVDLTTYPEYEIGEEVIFDKELEVTVTKLDVDDTVKLVAEADKAVVVDVTIKNTSKEDYYLDEYDFVLYDSYDFSYELDYRTYDANIPEKLAPDETATLRLVYGADEDDNYRLVFNEVIWSQSVGDAV